ncbi:MAG: Rho-binding antiterminator [Gammaproteobacteria bacterium]|nr:Rho-binding antiterminator [Gammaproteobacteria bacterium]
MIKCNEYDYIEIVCLYHYQIKLTIKSGGTIEGVALDTQRNDAREECIKLDVKGTEQLVKLDDISTLAVCVANPNFNQVTFD